MSQRDRQISEIFLAASDLAGERRADYLDAACGDDRELRAEVESLLEHDDPSSLIVGSSGQGHDRAETNRGTDEERPDDQSLSIDSINERSSPTQIGRYRIEKILGQGGFGVVYLARDDQLERLVAVKVPRAKLVKRPEDAGQYLAEARTVANLDHPHIVPIYDVGSSEDIPCYIVSKYIEGTNLASKIGHSRTSSTEAAALVATVAEALHHAHQQGTVHRDIKPGNILIDRTGKPFVVDFGMALRNESSDDFTRFAGTPAYMSPEQARGEGHRVDGRSDIFSLGVVFYELLVGRQPFTGDTPTQVLRHITSQEPRPLRQYDDSIPKELERICQRALSKRASQRYSTARDMADDLRQFLSEQSELPGSAPSATGPRASKKTVTSREDSTPGGSGRRITVIPKGLRSFDAEDADFFLELLPGPRDREGLPDSLRFWKRRIEETDADCTFTVGLIYGPSGCGKTSLVKAGLLPRLSEDVISVYVESTTIETESRLLNRLRWRCPALEANLSLKDTLASLRLGQGITYGKKVLIVLDQFEQWLHARKEEERTELVDALRQCDGGRIQCIVMVRDDFWLAATRFMDALEIDLLQGQNTALIDLFDLRHARRVLTAFGRAFGALPDIPDEITKEHKRFLEQVVNGLEQDGKIVCVRLALFAEMVKAKSWTPSTLQQVGGTSGVGVTFLEETFSAPGAHPKHRLHQKAAREVLRTLLPESGTSIKGYMCSSDELQHASGYTRTRDFDELIRILDSETRLVTPTDPAGLEADEDRPSAAESGQKYYQLTHDYLVRPIRAWLTRKQKETRRGRAELLLAERADLWVSKPESRHLPAWWEYGNIRLLTDKKNWTEPQRKMMARAGRIHGVRWGTALIVAIVIGITIQQIVSAARHRNVSNQVQTTVSSLNAGRGIVQPPLRDLDDFPRDMVLTELREQFETADGARKLALAYALAHFDDVRFDFLIPQVETASPDEVDNFVVALDRNSTETVTALENAARTAESEKNWRLKARLAMLALHLKAASLAQGVCRLRPDPIQRTLFIEECSTWHGDLSKLAQLVADSDDGPLRSGIILAVGSVPIADVLPSDKQAWGPVLLGWYENEPDTLAHSAAGWVLRRWNLTLPEFSASKQPVEDYNWHVNSVGMSMLKIPAGSFVRKDSRYGDDVIDQTVRLTRSFLLADREVTRAQFQQFIDDPDCPVAEKPSGWNGAIGEYSPTEQHPVQTVNWYDAVLFCNWLSRQEQLTPCYEASRLIPEANGYRLPTEAEWEYACRAGTVTTFTSGNDESLLDRYAVYRCTRTELPGSKLPNGWGLFDVHGNVSEWCHDWYGPFDSHVAVSDPMGRDQGAGRVLRGGSFGLNEPHVRSAYRHAANPVTRVPNIGFRVARTYP